MKNSRYWKELLLALVISAVSYMVLLSTIRTGLVDMSIEAILFLSGSIIAFRGFFKSKKKIDKNFRRFELFYGLTYFIVVISFILGISYFIKNPNVTEIGVSDITNNNLLIIMSIIKSFTMVFLILTWSCFYKYLNIEESNKKKITMFFLGFLFYLGASIIIWQLTSNINVLSLGAILGIVIGIFAMMSLDKRTKYLTIIFTAYSSIHLIEFYMMGIGKHLTTGLNNPVYWGVTVLYVFEVKRWIESELNKD
ncbi:hypothetical protein [Vallitalea maricola]|uniref:Uncharacterized protein n=1 Tax=Vallitalea maricola TaxID=3074433 RepID=A0ACB5UJV7_9FIRM|nr:hypothetical protein AN2V17_21220 [Vallitalea sp. AN17-2]